MYSTLEGGRRGLRGEHPGIDSLVSYVKRYCTLQQYKNGIVSYTYTQKLHWIYIDTTDVADATATYLDNFQPD
jgi:hypothetical protein